MAIKKDIELFYTIVSEEMVWLYYYDQYRTKHFKELLGREAKGFIDKCKLTDNNERSYQQA